MLPGMTKKILLVQHTDGTTPGHTLSWLKDRGHSFQHISLYKGETFPDLNEVSALILCGGGVHVDQEDKYPWLRPEKNFVERAIHRGLPIVGLCLGGQLCAQVLGAKVYPHPQGWEVGWHPVNLRETPDLPGFEIDQELIFSQYHRYIFELPPGAKAIAWNDWWAVQAFEWKQQVLGFQFHPERDAAGNLYKAEDPDPPSADQGRVHGKDEILRLGGRHEPQTARWFLSMLDGFIGKKIQPD